MNTFYLKKQVFQICKPLMWCYLFLSFLLPNVANAQEISCPAATYSYVVWDDDEIGIKLESIELEVGPYILYNGYSDYITLPVNDSVYDFKWEFFGLNIPENSGNSKAELYPNPARDFVTLKPNDVKIKSYHIVNLTGEVLFKNHSYLEQEEQRIDVSSLTKGLYYLVVVSEDGNDYQTLTFSKL